MLFTAIMRRMRDIEYLIEIGILARGDAGGRSTDYILII